MSRTYRNIPDYSRRGTKTVRDKDNHGCVYSKPKSFTQPLNRKMRTHTNQQLRELSKGPTGFDTDKAREFALELEPLPDPTEYKEYYW